MTDPDQPPEVVEYSVQIDDSPGGRHANDQILARVTAELDQHLDGLRRSWQRGADRTDFVAGWATALQAAEEMMPRDRLASLLAVAMCRLLWQEVDP